MIQHFTQHDIEQLEQRQRARFINSLSGFKSANLVATKDVQGVTNLAMISSVFHIGANPALVGMIIRPDTVPRDTLSNIKSSKEYTINHVSSLIWQQAHQTSARYDADVSEFEQVGLDEEYIEGVHAPFVAQSQLKFSLNLREIIELKINGTVMVIGEVEHVLVPASSVQSDGYIDIEALDTVAISGLDGYHTTQHLGRLSYAKTDKPVTLLCVDGAPYEG